jgi:multiple antibiotic resistance protein
MSLIDPFFIVAISTMVTIVNPVGAVGPFLAMTGDDTMKKRREIAWRAATVALGVLVVCAALGGLVFRFYGITLPAVKIAGGILLMNVAIDMINARQSRSKSTNEETEEGILKSDPGVFPIGIPLLAGPGSIVSVLLLSERAETIGQQLWMYVALCLVSAFSFLVLAQAHRVIGLLGKTGMNILSRLMGLILASTAIQFIINGVSEALPGLGRG